jgi:hypothetical protein
LHFYSKFLKVKFFNLSNKQLNCFHQLGKTQAYAKKHLLPKVRASVELGSAYDIQTVLVTKNEPRFAVTKHMFRLNLIDRAKYSKIDGSNIPLNHFDFMSFPDILESDREEIVVGK